MRQQEEEEEESQGPTARELEQAAIREKLAEIQRDKLRQGEWGDLFYNLQQRFGALVSEPQIWQCIQQHKGPHQPFSAGQIGATFYLWCNLDLCATSAQATVATPQLRVKRCTMQKKRNGMLNVKNSEMSQRYATHAMVW